MADPDFFEKDTLIPTPLNDDANIPSMAEKRHMAGVPPSRIPTPKVVKTFSPSPQPPQMEKPAAQDQHVHMPALPVERAASNEFENTERVPGTNILVPKGYNFPDESASIRRRPRKRK